METIARRASFRSCRKTSTSASRSVSPTLDVLRVLRMPGEHNNSKAPRHSFLLLLSDDEPHYSAHYSAAFSSKSSFSVVQPVSVASPLDRISDWIFSRTASAALLSSATNETANLAR